MNPLMYKNIFITKGEKVKVFYNNNIPENFKQYDDKEGIVLKVERDKILNPCVVTILIDNKKIDLPIQNIEKCL
jgi:hypothetical protein